MASRGPEVEAHVMGHPKEAQEGHEGQLGACKLPAIGRPRAFENCEQQVLNFQELSYGGRWRIDGGVHAVHG